MAETNLQHADLQVLGKVVSGPAPATNKILRVENEAFTSSKRLCFNTGLYDCMRVICILLI